MRAKNTDVIAFYESVGFAVEDVVNLGKRLVNDEAWNECFSPGFPQCGTYSPDLLAFPKSLENELRLLLGWRGTNTEQ